MFDAFTIYLQAWTGAKIYNDCYVRPKGRQA